MLWLQIMKFIYLFLQCSWVWVEEDLWPLGFGFEPTLLIHIDPIRFKINLGDINLNKYIF